MMQLRTARQPIGYVAIADRPVCSLLGSDGNGAKVDGQDGSASVVQSGQTFWTFGDSFIGTNVPRIEPRDGPCAATVPTAVPEAGGNSCG